MILAHKNASLLKNLQFFLTPILSISFLMPAVSVGAEKAKIAALVNDEVISRAEYDGRLSMMFFESGLPRNEHNEKILKTEALRALVDEKLQTQEALEKKIKVTDEDVTRGLEAISGQNNMDVDGLTALLKRGNVPINTMKNQVKANILWQQYLYQRASGDVTVSPEEVEERLNYLKDNAGKPQYLVAVIDLLIDKPEKEKDVKELADQLYVQMKKGTPFSMVARQFSQSAAAPNGGDMGWVMEGQMMPEVDAVLTKLSPGEISHPIRSPFGYHIVLVRSKRKMLEADNRDAMADLRQLHIVFDGTEDEARKAELRQEAEKITSEVRGCPAFEAASKKYDSGMTGNVDRVKLGEMPDQMYMLLSAIDVGKPTHFLENETGLLILMICHRDEAQIEMPSEEKIQQKLYMEKIDVLQRRLMRDLRNNAYIEIRI